MNSQAVVILTALTPSSDKLLSRVTDEDKVACRTFCRRSLSGRLPPHPKPDDGVHAAKVDEEHADDQQLRWRNGDHRPDVVEDHRPPLDEEDDVECHHHLGRVLIALDVGAHQIDGTTDRHPDTNVRQGYSDEDEQFKDDEELTVIRPPSVRTSMIHLQ